MMTYKKKALVISPHPDDEINIAGQFIDILRDNSYEIVVLYTTNGDSSLDFGNRRICEALEALRVLNVQESNVIFLGYSNEWEGGQHLYDKTYSKPLLSKSKRTSTSSIESKPEYCLKKHGVHHEFTRENFKADLKEIILDIEADIIICPDFDSHLDHRAASLMFEEVMGEILIEKKDYEPVVLKKFLYSGIWKGPKDFYDSPMKETLNTISSVWGGAQYETESPYLAWETRIQLMPSANTCTFFITNNILYKAAKKHKTQIAWYQLLRILNADLVYWWRPTSSILKYATISVSSGHAKYLTDFKMYDSSRLFDGPDKDYMNYMWAPSVDDNIKAISVFFDDYKDISQIRIYNDYNSKNRILSVELIWENQKKTIENVNSTEIIWEINTNIQHVKKIEIKILRYRGIPGMVELEMYSKRPDFYETVPFEKYRLLKKHKNAGIFALQKIEYFFLNVKLAFEYKIPNVLKFFLRGGNSGVKKDPKNRT